MTETVRFQNKENQQTAKLEAARVDFALKVDGLVMALQHMADSRDPLKDGTPIIRERPPYHEDGTISAVQGAYIWDEGGLTKVTYCKPAAYGGRYLLQLEVNRQLIQGGEISPVNGERETVANFYEELRYPAPEPDQIIKCEVFSDGNTEGLHGRVLLAAEIQEEANYVQDTLIQRELLP